jgi:CheY-like chemotaxis protein
MIAIDDLVKVLDALTRLVGVLTWPTILVFVLVRFGSNLRKFFSTLGEFTLKAAGFEASAKRMQAEATGAIVAATISRNVEGTTPEATAKEARVAAEVVSEVVTPRIVRRASSSTVLWVDDRPNNNTYERQSMEALGVSFVLAASTDEALELVKQRPFDAIISDMGRALDRQAGYTFLEKLRASGDRTPFIIYAGSDSPNHRAEAKRRGALTSTNRPDELFEAVVSVIGGHA